MHVDMLKSAMHVDMLKPVDGGEQAGSDNATVSSGARFADASGIAGPTCERSGDLIAIGNPRDYGTRFINTSH